MPFVTKIGRDLHDFLRRDDTNWLEHTLASKGEKAGDVRLDEKDVILIDDPIFKSKEHKYE
jgi:succinate dehydrogenase / fumarate reductase flavoprotein subunit